MKNNPPRLTVLDNRLSLLILLLSKVVILIKILFGGEEAYKLLKLLSINKRLKARKKKQQEQVSLHASYELSKDMQRNRAQTSVQPPVRPLNDYTVEVELY